MADGHSIVVVHRSISVCCASKMLKAVNCDMFLLRVMLCSDVADVTVATVAAVQVGSSP